MSRNLKQAPQYAPQQQVGMAPPGAIPPPPSPLDGGGMAPKMDPRTMTGVMPPPPQAPTTQAMPMMGGAPPAMTGGHFGFSRPMVRR